MAQFSRSGPWCCQSGDGIVQFREREGSLEFRMCRVITGCKTLPQLLSQVPPDCFALYNPGNVLAECRIPNRVMRPSLRATKVSRLMARKPRVLSYLMDLQCHSHKRARSKPKFDNRD